MTTTKEKTTQERLAELYGHEEPTPIRAEQIRLRYRKLNAKDGGIFDFNGNEVQELGGLIPLRYTIGRSGWPTKKITFNPPSCSSPDGVLPFPDVPAPVSAECEGCPWSKRDATPKGALCNNVYWLHVLDPDHGITFVMCVSAMTAQQELDAMFCDLNERKLPPRAALMTLSFEKKQNIKKGTEWQQLHIGYEFVLEEAMAKQAEEAQKKSFALGERGVPLALLPHPEVPSDTNGSAGE